MRTPSDRIHSLRDAIELGGIPPLGSLIGATWRTELRDLLQNSPIESGVDMSGRSVLIACADQVLAAMAMIEMDGLARRIILFPPDLALEHLPYVMRYADVDAVVSDGVVLNGASIGSAIHSICSPTLVPRGNDRKDNGLATEWILLTSGTTGRPKMVLHTLASLTGAIVLNESSSDVVWGTFYDIRRYGGLQIFLRAVLTRSSLVLSGPQEPMATFLEHAGDCGVTHISGTPSHWRRALMCKSADRIVPRYIRLSGEIADQAVINSLRSFYPDAGLSHAFATTEAGVAFDVRDGFSGFPASMLTDTSGVELDVVDATLRIRSDRTAQRYLGEDPPALKDAEGYVDTGDVVELRGDRYYFQGRRDGTINVGGLKVHPEEVEAVLNRHPLVRLSLVRTKKNPITGALVVAEVLLNDSSTPEGAVSKDLQQSIKQYCRESLAAHKVPTAISFVPSIAISENGKLVRRHG